MSDITWTPTTIPLRALTPWERNPKRISKAHAARLLDLWERLGQFQTIAIGPGGEVYDGHQRLSVLKAKHGGGYVVQVLQASRELTEAEREELTIAAHSGTTGSWDWDALAGWDVDNLTAWGLDEELLKDWNAGATALREMLAAETAATGEDPGPQVDKAAELQAKWGTATGQMWLLDSGNGYEHRLICGDCTDAAVVARVMGGEQADYILTDPPYCSGGFQESGRSRGSVGTTAVHKQIAADTLSTRGYMALIKAMLSAADTSAAYVFTDWRMWVNLFDAVESSGFGVRQMIVWDKETPGMGHGWRAQHELILFALKGTISFDKFSHAQGNVIQAQRTGNKEHTTEKPVEVLETIIGVMQDMRVVYDPFCGSGTTIIACERLGRRCRACEIEPSYVGVALERWATMTGQTPALLDGAP